jgi:hypothetical protein
MATAGVFAETFSFVGPWNQQGKGGWHLAAHVERSLPYSDAWLLKPSNAEQMPKRLLAK